MAQSVHAREECERSGMKMCLCWPHWGDVHFLGLQAINPNPLLYNPKDKQTLCFKRCVCVRVCAALIEPITRSPQYEVGLRDFAQRAFVLPVTALYNQFRITLNRGILAIHYCHDGEFRVLPRVWEECLVNSLPRSTLLCRLLLSPDIMKCSQNLLIVISAPITNKDKAVGSIKGFIYSSKNPVTAKAVKSNISKLRT